MLNNLRNIFIDFDGTLIDSRERLYYLFQELIPQSKLSFSEYWEIKRSRVDHKQLLQKNFALSIAEIEIFREKWLSKVEEFHRLSLDVPISGVPDVLARLNDEGYTLHLVTARQNEEFVHKQLDTLSWRSYFDHVLVTCQRINKEQLIRNNILFSQNDILIGDTGEDIITAKALGMRSIAVTSGILSSEILNEYKPDFICKSILNIHESQLL